MIKIETVRKITKFVIGGSVWWTVGNVIDNNLTPDSRRHKIEAYLGSAAIGWVVREQANQYIDRKFDKMIEAWNTKEKTLEALKNKDEVTEDITISASLGSDPIQDKIS